MGNQEVDFNDFGGSQEVFRFGNCDGGTNRTMPSPTSSPGETMPTDPVSGPTESPGDYECRSGESLVQLYLETDQSSGSENQLFLWDVAAREDEWVWIVGLNEFESNTVYNGYACLLPSHCYQFAFSDESGDGLATGELTLIQEGQVVFQISPGDIGTTFDMGSTASYWLKEFGACSSTSTSSANLYG